MTDYSKIRNWKQVVSIIIAIAIVPLTSSPTIFDETAMIKVGVIGGLLTLVFYIIKTDNKVQADSIGQSFDLHLNYLKANIDLLEEVTKDVENKIESSTVDAKMAYQDVADKLNARLSQVKLVYEQGRKKD